MRDPVDLLIEMNPVSGDIITKAGPVHSNTVDVLPGTSGDVTKDIIGAFSNVVDTELDGDAVAIFTIRTADAPVIVPEVSELMINGETYVIRRVRSRYWLGRLNGYTLGLGL